LTAATKRDRTGLDHQACDWPELPARLAELDAEELLILVDSESIDAHMNQPILES